MSRNNISFIVHRSSFIVSLLLTVVSLCYADEPNIKEPIVVNGDKVEYFHEEKRVIGSGNISIEYKGATLVCEKVTVYLDTREAIAEGSVKVTEKSGAYLTGEKINYNFDTQKGAIVKGYVSAKPFYGRAQEVDKVSDKQFNLERGYATTCDLEKPHYRIQSRQVRIYLDDKVVAKHILFFVGNVPILYMPYYVQPIKEAKKSHITVIPGKDKDWGYYALTAYRYYFSDASRGDILLDYRSKKGLAEGINHYYDTKGLGSGAFKIYYAEEDDRLAYERSSGESKIRYRYQARHRWDMGDDADTVAIMELNKLSDKDVIKDYTYKEYEEIQTPEDYNYISIITTKPYYTTEFLLRKRFDKFLTIVERLPEYRININNTRIIKDAPLYYQANTSGVYLNKAFDGESSPGQKDLNVVRFDAYNQLSYSGKLFKFWNITPYAGTEQTFYSRNIWGDTNIIRGNLTAGINNSTKFYRVYDIETNFMGLDIHKLRHVITPTADYSYAHQPTVSSDELNQFDSIDALGPENHVVLALENKLQTKRQSGGDSLKSFDLATLIVSTDYKFRLKRNNLDFKNQKFENINFQLELTPYPWLYTLAKMTVSTKRYLVESASLDIVGNGGDRWFFGAGYRHEKTSLDASDIVTMDATYRINDKWKVRAYERCNLGKMAFAEQEYTIYRDLHCWLAEFTYNIKSLEDQGIWFVMRLKAFPDTPIGLKRTYYRPQFGSAGN